MRLPRRRDSQQPDPHPAVPHAPTPPPAPAAASPASRPAPAATPPAPVGHTVHEAVRILTTPMPFDVAADHEGILVIAAGHAPLAAIDHDATHLLAIVLEELGRGASERGCDGLYSVHHTLAIHDGVAYITAMGTGSRPTPNLDGPPPGS